MLHFIRDYLLFTKKEKRGIIVLLSIVLLLLVFNYLSPIDDGNVKTINSLSPSDRAQLDAFVASFQTKKNVDRKSVFKGFKHNDIVYHPFNPNSVDSIEMISLGIPAWMTRNIINYRKKGGKFKSREDLRKIYGMDEDRFQRLFPYIDIPVTPVEIQMKTNILDTTSKKIYTHQVKLMANETIELNSADTSALKMIPGVGSGIAYRIVRFREKLGGFYTVAQLGEIGIISDSVRRWVTIDASMIQKININKASLKELMKHPYLNFYQAKVIIDYRNKKGSIKSVKPFVLYDEFSESQLKKIEHYIRYDDSTRQ